MSVRLLFLQVYIYYITMDSTILSRLYHGFLLMTFVLIFYNIFITTFRFLLLAGTS